MKDHLSDLKSKLELLEKTLEDKVTAVNTKGDKWESLEERVNSLLAVKKEDIVDINVGGKHFSTTMETLMSVKDNLFWKVIISKKLDISKGIFIDRSPEMFPYILDYLRYHKINMKRLKPNEILELKEEIMYYELIDLESEFEKASETIEFVRVEVNLWYDGVGEKDVKVLSDTNLNTGLCTNSPGWMIIELNREVEFDQLDIGGYTGNSDWVYSPGYGSGAAIQTSTDKKSWKNVGTIPSGFGTVIMNCQLTKSKAKYIKFEGTGWLGIGYVKVKHIY